MYFVLENFFSSLLYHEYIVSKTKKLLASNITVSTCLALKEKIHDKQQQQQQQQQSLLRS